MLIFFKFPLNRRKFIRGWAKIRTRCRPMPRKNSDMFKPAPSPFDCIIGMLYTTVAVVMRYVGGSYQAGGEFFGAVAAPAFGSLGAASVFSPNSLILMCMLSNAYISHFM